MPRSFSQCWMSRGCRRNLEWCRRDRRPPPDCCKTREESGSRCSQRLLNRRRRHERRYPSSTNTSYTFYYSHTVVSLICSVKSAVTRFWSLAVGCSLGVVPVRKVDRDVIRIPAVQWRQVDDFQREGIRRSHLLIFTITAITLPRLNN